MDTWGWFVDTPMYDLSGGARLTGGCWLAKVGVSAQLGPAPGSGSNYGVEPTA